MIGRLIEPSIRRAMEMYPSVTLFGPRQCGKTTLARSMFPEFSYANLEEFTARMLASSDPNEFFRVYPEPVIIDEIQRVPELLSTIQYRIDERKQKGQYLITGSRQIALKSSVVQSLAGRTAIIDMLPLSLRELSDAGIRLGREEQILAGGMPFLYGGDGFEPSRYYSDYIDTYVSRDIAEMSQIHDWDRFLRFLHLLAGRTGQLVNASALAADTGVTSTTIGSWLSLLEASHLIYVLKPWYRSRTSQIVKTPKIYFTDTGVACFLLGITTPSQVSRDPLVGNLFENMVVIEVLKARYDSYAVDDGLFFYRTSNGTEIDLILDRRDKMDLFEIKAGQAVDGSYLKAMRSFIQKHGDAGMHVVFSGQTCRYLGADFLNYMDVYEVFRETEEPYRLNFRKS